MHPAIPVSLRAFLKLEMELENFLDKSLFFSPCHETRKRFFTITYCSRWDLSRFLSSRLTLSPTLPFRPLHPLLRHPSRRFSPVLPSFLSSRTVDIQDEHSRAFEIAVSIKSVMGRRFSFHPASQWAYTYPSCRGAVERDRVAVFARNLRRARCATRSRMYLWSNDVRYISLWWVFSEMFSALCTRSSATKKTERTGVWITVWILTATDRRVSVTACDIGCVTNYKKHRTQRPKRVNEKSVHTYKHLMGLLK